MEVEGGSALSASSCCPYSGTCAAGQPALRAATPPTRRPLTRRPLDSSPPPRSAPLSQLRLEAVPELGYAPSGPRPQGEVCLRGPALFK
jgi:hypothetical protein